MDFNTGEFNSIEVNRMMTVWQGCLMAPYSEASLGVFLKMMAIELSVQL